jgi:lipopolysaccharide export system protein LptA
MFSMMSKSVLLLNIGLLLAVASTPTAAVQAAPAKASATTATRTTIISERMTVRNKERQAVFEGKVVLTKGDLVVRSDKMVVYYKPKDEQEVQTTPAQDGQDGESETGSMEVSKIEATGRVRIERNEGRATCQKAVYHKDEEKVVLTGKPLVWEGGNRVSGKRITMYLVEDRTIVEGGSRVLLD